MDYEKLIERLNGLYTALREEGEQKCSPEINTVAFVLMDAASAISTLQAENESLRADADVAEVRHGRWIENTFCSCCGGFDEDDKGNIIQSFYNYCPNCGARMDKEDEHEAD